MTATLRAYLEQIGCVLRPASVTAPNVALCTFAAFLAEAQPRGHRGRSS